MKKSVVGLVAVSAVCASAALLAPLVDAQAVPKKNAKPAAAAPAKAPKTASPYTGKAAAFDVQGVKLGMTLDQVRGVLAKLKPALRIWENKAGDVVQSLTAEAPGASDPRDTFSVSFDYHPEQPRVIAISRRTQYGAKTAPSLANMRAALDKKYTQCPEGPQDPGSPHGMVQLRDCGFKQDGSAVAEQGWKPCVDALQSTWSHAGETSSVPRELPPANNCSVRLWATYQAPTETLTSGELQLYAIDWEGWRQAVIAHNQRLDAAAARRATETAKQADQNQPSL